MNGGTPAAYPDACVAKEIPLAAPPSCASLIHTAITDCTAVSPRDEAGKSLAAYERLGGYRSSRNPRIIKALLFTLDHPELESFAEREVEHLRGRPDVGWSSICSFRSPISISDFRFQI